MAKKPSEPTLENSLTEINTVIEKMEQGDLSLEESLNYFERGIKLIKQAQKTLREAEQKVQILMKNNDNEKLSDYENNDK
jgi:exodeoxyribonuclease VII small subunit